MLASAKRMAFLMMLLGAAFAQSGFAEDNPIKEGVCLVADTAKAIMASVIFALVIMAAVVYAAGQVFGAETRSRATVWATAMIIGAVIGILIFVLLPQILDAFGGSQVSVVDAC